MSTSYDNRTYKFCLYCVPVELPPALLSSCVFCHLAPTTGRFRNFFKRLVNSLIPGIGLLGWVISRKHRWEYGIRSAVKGQNSFLAHFENRKLFAGQGPFVLNSQRVR